MDSSMNNAAGSSAATHPREYRGLQMRDWLELISNAAIPLMIGIISLWIAIHQQKVAQMNREKDLALGAELRKQDLKLAQLQREEDKETARLQRVEDRETARLQREEDQKTSQLQRDEDRETARLQRAEDRETARLQRELDLNVTNDKRIQDYELAEKERNLSEIQRAKEFKVAYENRINDLMLEDDRQKENVLLEYQDDLAQMLLDYGPLLKDSQSKWWVILQMKTGAALRQLDPARRTVLIHTLLEAGYLDINIENERSLVYTANLSGVEFGQSLDRYIDDICVSYEYLHIAEADVRYASFHGVCFRFSPFFNFSDLDYTDWSYSKLLNIYFDGEITMNEAKFAKSILKGTRFSKTIRMNHVSFQYNIECNHCKFVKTSLVGARLDHSNFLESTFTSLSIADGNMSNGSFNLSAFEGVTLDRVDFSGASLYKCDFVAVSMINCSLSNTILDKVKFDNVNMTGCKGLTDQQISVTSYLYETTLPNGTFVKGKRN